MIFCHLKDGQIWRAKVQVRTLREAYFKFWNVLSIMWIQQLTSSNAMNALVGSKERVRIPLSGKHCSLQAFVKHVVEHAGLREEAQKRGLGSSIDIKDNRKLDLHNGSYLRCPD